MMMIVTTGLVGSGRCDHDQQISIKVFGIFSIIIVYHENEIHKNR